MAPVGADGLPWHRDYFPHIYCDKCDCILYVKRKANRTIHAFPTNKETRITLANHYQQSYLHIVKFLKCIFQFDNCILRVLPPDILEQIIKYIPNDIPYCSPPKKSKNHCVIL